MPSVSPASSNRHAAACVASSGSASMPTVDSRRRTDVQTHQSECLEVVLGPLQREHRSAAIGQVASRGRIAVSIDGPASRLHVAGCCRLMCERRRLRALFRDNSQVPRRAERAPTSWTTGPDPVRRQPVEGSWAVERKCVGRRMGPVAVWQTFETAGHADQRVVRLDTGARVGDPELRRAHHHVLDCAGAREQRHLTRHGVDTGGPIPSAPPTARTACRAPMLTCTPTRMARK
jgi:hypothetical protein